MKKIAQKAFTFALFVFCILLLIGDRAGITGATAGIPKLSIPISMIILLIAIFSGILLFIGQKYAN
jgi:uncharacterized membrane protein YtjA (UPF0391 family)